HREGFYHITSTSPYFLAGLKTLAYELVAEINPDYVVFPVGEGGNITMFWQGLGDLRRSGATDARPRLVAVQSEGCMPIVQAYNSGRSMPEWRSAIKTIFTDIAVPNPSLGPYVIKSLRESHGLAISVSDIEILQATKDLARWEGILAEPAAASTIAALRKMAEDGRLGGDENVVCVVTGSGLKEPYIERPSGRAERSIAARALTASRVGVTKSHILQLLAERPSYGYAIRRDLARRFGIQVSTTSVYQHLAELAYAGLVTARSTTYANRRRTLYSLTPTGRQKTTH
ncbi:MAG: pyridoxal-phosphate dependent enzyme, partial [Nitrososphaerota archaeon]